MASITLDGNPINTSGEIPKIGTKAPGFTLVNSKLSEITLQDFAGHQLLLNIFPSVETGVCSAAVRKFNQIASGRSNTKVLCISRDLPFAQSRFCASAGLENVINLSDFKTGQFGKDYGLEITEGIFGGLHSRVVLIVDETGTIVYAEQVPEIATEPNYTNALAVLK